VKYKSKENNARLKLTPVNDKDQQGQRPSKPPCLCETTLWAACKPWPPRCLRLTSQWTEPSAFFVFVFLSLFDGTGD
jgi:hypothetical protein